MLLSAVSVLVVAQSIFEIPEGLMNNPVYFNFTFPQDTQVIMGTVLIVKCQPMILNILTR